MEEIGKERGMFVRERVGTRFGFPSYALYLVLRAFKTRGERGGGLKLWYFPNPLGKVYGG